MHPELIEASLEDFASMREVPQVVQFFDLLKHINRPDGLLETNDCGCRVIAHNDRDDGPWPQSRLRFSGRLMLLFRHWLANTDANWTASLHDSFQVTIRSYASESKAVIGLSYFPVVFPSLAGEPVGRQLVTHWWTWGDTELETWRAFGDVVTALLLSVQDVERQIIEQNPRSRSE